MKAVCLFDIDGTLLTTGGAGQTAMERALSAVFGIDRIEGEILAAGRTDRAITADLFAAHGVDADAASFRRFVSEYLRRLPETLRELQGRILPGVVELLDTISARGDISVGLLTGNFRDGAAVKLRHYQLEHHFAYGGFGDEHHDRDDVARSALAAARERDRQDWQGDAVWVLGDTPSDVRCARAIGARAVAVATGIFSHAELDRTAPDLLMRDFSDPEPFLRRLFA